MSVVEPPASGEEGAIQRLTVKDKILVQMGEHLCEPDIAEYPLELTQKGLSECLGIRRSHIAASMKDLLEDGYIDVHKGHIEGESRQQNAYLLTPKGQERAKELREKVVRDVVELEEEGEIKKSTVEDVMASTSLTIASVFKQLDHGGPLKDETTVVTKPGPQLIKVYCPNCKSNFEVENIYGDEEAGFDCPGCGRPYRVVPVRKEVPVEQKTSSAGMTRGQLIAAISTIAMGLLILEVRMIRSDLLTSPIFTALYFAIPAFLIVTFFAPKSSKRASRASVRAASVIMTMFVLGLIVVQLWNLLIIKVDYERQTTISVVIMAALGLGYLGTRKQQSQTRGEYLLAAGLTLLLVAFVLPFLRNIQGLTMESVPFIGLIGMTAAILSSFHYVEREIQLLDAVLAAGIIVLLVSAVLALANGNSMLDAIVFGSLMILGFFMVSLRFAQTKSEIDVGAQFLAAVLLSTGLLFAILGAFMIWGDAPVAGLVEIALVSPFVFLGARQVFSSEWMYRVPILAYLTFVEALILTDAFLA